MSGPSPIGLTPNQEALLASVAKDATIAALIAILNAGTSAQVVGTIPHGVADDGSNPQKIGGRVYTTSPTLIDGQRAELTFDTKGHAGIALFGANSNSAISGGTTARGMSSTSNRLAVYGVEVEFNGTTYDHKIKTNTAFTLLSSTAGTNLNYVKTATCEAVRISAVNTSTSPRYLKIYNKASGIVVGTDVPVFTFYMPPSSVNGGLFEKELDRFYLSAGCAFAITANAAVNDTTAILAGDIVCLNATVCA